MAESDCVCINQNTNLYVRFRVGHQIDEDQPGWRTEHFGTEMLTKYYTRLGTGINSQYAIGHNSVLSLNLTDT